MWAKWSNFPSVGRCHSATDEITHDELVSRFRQFRHDLGSLLGEIQQQFPDVNKSGWRPNIQSFVECDQVAVDKIDRLAIGFLPTQEFSNTFEMYSMGVRQQG